MIRLIYIFIVTSFLLSCNAQENKQFEVGLFGNNNDIPKDCIELSDENILIIGQHFQDDYYSKNNPKVASLVKIDKTGNLLWEKSFGYNKDDRFSQIIKKDNFLYVLGSSTKTDYLKRQIWVLKLDLEGNIIKEAFCGEYSEGIKISFNNNNEILILGNMFSKNNNRKFGNQASYIVNLDHSLNLNWDKIIEQENGFHSLENIHNVGHEIYLVGKSLFREKYKTFIKRLDENGNEKENVEILLSSGDFPISSLLVNEKIIIVSNNEDQRNIIDLHSVDLNTKKVVTNEISFRKNVGINDFIQNRSGEYILVGYSWGDNHDYCFMKIDGNFKLISEKYYGESPFTNELVRCLQLGDKSYITLGYSNFKAKNSVSNKWFISKKL